MKEYKVLTIFYNDVFVYCFDDYKTLFNYIIYNCSSDIQFYVETKWLSDAMIKKLDISYIKYIN